MDHDLQNYSDDSNCCQAEVTMHIHPEEQDDLQLDSESDTSGIYFPPPNNKKNFVPNDVNNDFDDIGDNSQTLSECSIDLEQVINPISKNGKSLRSPYLLRSRSSSPVKQVDNDENSQIRVLDNKSFPKIDLGSKNSKSQRRKLIKSSLPPVKESDESIPLKSRKSEPCSSKTLEDDIKVVNTNDDQNDLSGYFADNERQEDQEIIEKAVKNGPLVLNINFSLNCDKDKPMILSISPQYNGNNSAEEIKFQCNASTSAETPSEDLDCTAEISSLNNEKGNQEDKMRSQTDDMGCQTDDIGCQTDGLNETTGQSNIIPPGPSKNPTIKTEKKGTRGKSQPNAKAAKSGNKPQTKEVNRKRKGKKKEGPKRPRARPPKPQRSSNCNFSNMKLCRHFSSSTSSSSDECCSSDTTSSSSTCSCSSCCPSSSSCDCSNCDD